MSIAVRTIESSNANYKFFTIELLEDNSNGNFMNHLTPFASITFQQNQGETVWYGMRFVIDTNRYKDLKLFSTIASKVNKECDYKSQPEDVLEVLNAKEYFLFNNHFVSVEDKGKFMFRVETDIELYSYIIAKNLADAAKILKKARSKNRNFDNLILGDKMLIG